MSGRERLKPILKTFGPTTLKAQGARSPIIVRAIGDICRMLEEHPLAGRRRNEIRPGLRSALSNPYVIFYRVSGDAPEIVRVLDGRRDIDEIFSAESQ